MAVMRERTRARQQCCCEQQHSKLHGLDLSMDAVMDRTLAIDPLFRRAHRTCAAGDRSVMWRRLKRACAGARSPTRRARARAATDRRRGFAMPRRSHGARRGIAERDGDVARPALVADPADRAAFGVAQELRFGPREERRRAARRRGRCGRRAKSVARRGDRVAVPRARELAVVAAVDAIADQRAQRLRGCCPSSSIVRYEMQRRASSSYGATIAPVGHAAMHAVHVPQCALTGARHRQRQVGVDLAEEEIRAHVARQQQRVLAAPAEARLARRAPLRAPARCR